MRSGVAPVSLSWLLGADPGTLLDAPEDVVGVLVDLGKRPVSQHETDVVEAALRKVLRAAIDAGPVHGPNGRRLVSPALTYIRNREWSHRFAPELRVLAERDDLRGMKPLALAMDWAVIAGNEGRTPSDARVDAVDSGSAVREDTGCPPEPREDGPPTVDALRWARRRPHLGVAERASTDATVLAGLVDSLIPVPLAEALHGDDEVWAQSPMVAWCNELLTPLPASVNGIAAAALLNAKIRVVRPRLFLRHPQALVVEAIAANVDTAQMTRQLAMDVVEPILTALSTIAYEVERGRPRKSRVESARLNALRVIERLGMRQLNEIGDEVPFDMQRHLAIDFIEDGQLVRVSRGGLYDSATGAVLAKARVDPLHKEGTKNDA